MTMLMVNHTRSRMHVVIVAGLWAALSTVAHGQVPLLESVFPAGGQAGQSVEVAIAGSNLEKTQSMSCSVPGVRCEKLDSLRYRLSIPTEINPGAYDLWAMGESGISSPRTFVIGNRPEQQEAEPNEAMQATMVPTPLGTVSNGRLAKAGDVDCYRFEAKKGDRVVIECSAERIDSRLRAILELFDSTGRRLAVNRGYFGVDPLIDLQIPTDGSYFVRLSDLTSTGGREHFYRLEIDTGPRVAFTIPAVIPRGQKSSVEVFGWNLNAAPRTATNPGEFDRVTIDIPAADAQPAWPLPTTQHPAAVVLESMTYQFSGAPTPVLIGITDLPVITARSNHHSPETAQEIPVPSEVSGQLIRGVEQDWYAVQLRRGDVLHLDGYAQRIRSPIDLQLRILDPTGQRVLLTLGDSTAVSEGNLPTSHLDPSGRWVAPADGRFLIAVQNAIGGLNADPRRVYRLSVRREEPDFQVVAVPRRNDAAPLNIRRGGCEVLDLIAFRQRGFQGEIRVSARDLPAGVECPDVFLGPGVDRGIAVISVNQGTAPLIDELKLEAQASDVGTQSVRAGTVVRSGTTIPWGRLISRIPMAVTGDAPVQITADGHQPWNHHLYGKLKVRHSPGGIVDVAVQVERRDPNHRAPVKLTAVGLPATIATPTSLLAADDTQGYLSFYLPPTLAIGHYSFTIRAETTIPSGQKSEPVFAYSPPVTINVEPAAFLVEVDPFAVSRAKRGDVIQIGYSAQRRSGFIGKMHTELAVPGHVTDIEGVRGRGETFVGQTEKGTLQIVINDNAPLGHVKFLRLLTVGVVEDEPIYQGSGLLNLEIVE